MFNLSKIRNELGVKQKDIANYLHMSQGNLSDWEHGRTQPDIEKIILLADYLNISIDYLLGRENKNILTIDNSNLMSDEEHNLIESFKIMNDKQKKYLKIYINTLLDKEIFKERRII